MCMEEQVSAQLQITSTAYFCFQDPEQLQDKSNEILTAIIQGMRKEEPSNNVKLAATNALLNSLEFTKANFDKEVSEGRRSFGCKVSPESMVCDEKSCTTLSST